ncbi:hypothetical protein [Hymenobacter sp. BT730]|uniref:hypothetical protein n=1 Tax=Hymenobacter sp. BT730 TaxID=3063332 RepID=UPI0026E0C3CC|nr:hypothetical protein [Hymenobacter sp. BT730]
MEKWLYTVWFIDNNLLPDEEDYEWGACIVIEANCAEDAKEWGDKLSKEYIQRNHINTFAKSGLVKFAQEDYTDISDLPFIEYGHLASDKEIGW